MASGYTRHDYKCNREYGGSSGGGKNAKTKGGHVSWGFAGGGMIDAAVRGGSSTDDARRIKANYDQAKLLKIELKKKGK